jgi:hypothetical protein
LFSHQSRSPRSIHDPEDIGTWEIEIGEKTKWISIYVIARDFSGNEGNYSFRFDVEDNIPPSLIKVTNSEPRTGEKVTFIVDVEENIDLNSTWMEYYFDDLEGHKRTILPDSIDLETGKAIFILELPVDHLAITFRVLMKDENGNTGRSDERTIGIIDTIPPSITDHSDLPVSGITHRFSFWIKDNIAFNDAQLLIKLDGKLWKTIRTEELVDDRWILTVDIPDKVRELEYTLIVEDTTSNEVIQRYLVDIRDLQLPHIEISRDILPFCGERYYLDMDITDNWDIKDGFIEWNFNNGQIFNRTTVGGPVDMDIIPENATSIYLRIGALDEGGNWNFLYDSLPVMDLIPPRIRLTYGGAFSDELMWVRPNVTDNIGIENIIIEDRLSGELISYNYKSGVRSFKVPPEKRMVMIIINATDISGNYHRIEELIPIEDRKAPEIILFENDYQGDNTIFTAMVHDNWDISSVWLTIENDGELRNYTLFHEEGRNYSVSISSDDIDGMNTIHLNVKDGSGNIQTSEPYYLNIDGSTSELFIVMIIMFVVMVIVMTIIIIVILAIRKA